MKNQYYFIIFIIFSAIIVFFVLNDAKKVDDIDSDVVEIQADRAKAVNDEQSSKILVAYYSRTGNTHEVATQIQEATEGDVFEVRPVISCPEDYAACKDFASNQKETNARPEVIDTVENMDDYDVVFVGYPIWLGTMPMHMFTFLEAYDFSGKTIVPFSTSGSSGIEQSESDIANLVPESNILEGLGVKGDDVAQSNDSVVKWISELNIEF